MKYHLSLFSLVGFLFFSPLQGNFWIDGFNQPSPVVLSEKSLSLTNRYPNPWVNEVFVDNMVLTLHYLKSDIPKPPVDEASWKKIKEPFTVSFRLKPGQTFAFQDSAYPEFKDKVVKTTKATFNLQQGFRSSGFLVGDGVCQLASLINWTAREAGLEVLSPTNHDFALIPDVPKKFGTSIFYLPDNPLGNARQNLYITNNKDKEIAFNFTVTQDRLSLTILE